MTDELVQCGTCMACAPLDDSYTKRRFKNCHITGWGVCGYSEEYVSMHAQRICDYHKEVTA